MIQQKILIVDDDISFLRVMQHHLEKKGYVVSTFSNGIDAIEEQKSKPAQIIFTDLKMPEMSGLTFMDSIREFDQNVPLVVITGFPTIDLAVNTMKAGAFDFIQKPVERERLLAVARKAIQYSELQHENERLRSLVEAHLDFGHMIGK